MSRLIKYGGEVIMPVTIHKVSVSAASKVKLDLSTIKLEDQLSWKMNGQIFQGEVCGIIRQAEYCGNGGWLWRGNVGVDIDIYIIEITYYSYLLQTYIC